MARRGLASPDTTGSYGFYDVRLRESLRREIVPLDSVSTRKLLLDDDALDGTITLEQLLIKKPKFDTIRLKDLKNLKVVPKDTVKTPADLRKERREDRRKARSNQ